MERELASRKIINRAKGLLMDYYHISDEEAYHKMQQTSMRRGILLTDVAQKIFESYGMSNNVLDCSNVEDAIRKIDKYLAEDSNKSTCENLLVYGKRIAMANQEMWSKVLLSNK